MGRIILYLTTVLLSASCILGNDNLEVRFQWKQVEFDYPSAETRRHAIETGEFIQENNLPLGLEVFGERLFITVPRWKKGVPASLTYINLSGLYRTHIIFNLSSISFVILSIIEA